MCTGGGGSVSVPTAPAIEPAKSAQSSMDAASDSTQRAQMMRRGVFSLFDKSRGYGGGQQTKSQTLG